MPRNASGVYTLAAGNPVDSGTLIEASWANNTLNDLASAMTDSLSRNGEGGMLAPFRLADGSLGAPGIAWTNEPSTGFYRSAAGTMWGVVGGAQILQYTSNGILIPSTKTLTAQGNASVGGNLSVTGTLAITGGVTFTGNATVGGTLGVTGATTLSSTLGVTGAITATGGVVGNLTGNVTGNVSGNAGTATALANTRTIWGQNFNGTANVTGALTGVTDLTASGNGSFGGTFGVTGVTTLADNLVLSGSAKRITGDFSNATIGNRVVIQSSTMNGNTAVTICPNGTAANSSFFATNSSDPNNASTALMRVNLSEMALISGVTGTGTYLPMSFLTNNTTQLTIATTGFGTATQDWSFQGVRVGRGASASATNTVVGASALNANTSGLYNTAVGWNAMTANTSGTRSVAVGYQALVANTTGDRNHAFGMATLAVNTTGNYNTAVGYTALNQSNGDNNTAVGYGALVSNTTASNNTAVGYQAGYTNSTGTQVSFIGYRSGYSNTTGNYNIAVGSQDGSGYPTLFSNTTGAYNTALGSGALALNTTASYSTALGYQAGYYNTGNYNTFIGAQTGYANTTGTNNTYVGSQSPGGTYAAGSSMTTGSKNTILGNYSGNNNGVDIRTVSNQVVLSDGDGNPWWRLDGTTGVAYLRQYGYNNNVPYMKISGFGYDPGSYKVVVLGGRTISGTSVSLAFGYDPLTNTGGSFGGLGTEMLFPNGVNFKTPNSGNTNFFNVMDFDASGYGIKVYGNVGVGGTQPASSGGGVSFPATQIASSDANTLDDYEEGTWSITSVLALTGTFTTVTVQSSSYTKIGNTVFCQAKIAITSIGTGADGFQINGLPFTPVIGNAFAIPGKNISADTNFNGYIENGRTSMRFLTTMTNSHTYLITATYFV